MVTGSATEWLGCFQKMPHVSSKKRAIVDELQDKVQQLESYLMTVNDKISAMHDTLEDKIEWISSKVFLREFDVCRSFLGNQSQTDGVACELPLTRYEEFDMSTPLLEALPDIPAFPALETHALDDFKLEPLASDVLYGSPSELPTVDFGPEFLALLRNIKLANYEFRKSLVRQVVQPPTAEDLCGSPSELPATNLDGVHAGDVTTPKVSLVVDTGFLRSLRDGTAVPDLQPYLNIAKVVRVKCGVVLELSDGDDTLSFLSPFSSDFDLLYSRLQQFSHLKLLEYSEKMFECNRFILRLRPCRRPHYMQESFKLVRRLIVCSAAEMLFVLL